MITFTPPGENLQGLLTALGVWAIQPPALILGLLVGLLGRRWYDAFWAIPVMIAYQMLFQAGYRELAMHNAAAFLVGLAPLPIALLILVVKELRARALD